MKILNNKLNYKNGLAKPPRAQVSQAEQNQDWSN